MKHINFLKKILFYFIALIFFSIIFSFCFLRYIYQPSKNNYLKEQIKKEERLKIKTNKKRIIFIGGSNLCFGLDSQKIDDAFEKYEVINLGLHAGLGLRYQINDFRNFFKKNDIIIIAPEWGNFYNGGYGDEALLEYLIIKKSLKNVDTIQMIKLIKISLNYCLKKIIFRKKTEKDLFGESFIYDQRGFNSYGDEISHWKYKLNKKIFSNTIKEKEIDKKIFNFLFEFNEEMLGKSISVFYIQPVCTQEYTNKNELKIIDVEKRINFLSEKNKYIFDKDLFFDTNYHLGYKGVLKRTDLIIKDLDTIINSK